MPNAAKYLCRFVKYFGITTIRDDKGLVDLQSDAFAQAAQQSTLMFIDGWAIRSPSLVAKHAAAVRDFFRPIDRHRNAAEQAVTEVRKTCSKVVGVHVRHGDYRGWLDGKYFFTVEQYQLWMRQISNLFPNETVGFVVCTDNPKDCEQLVSMDAVSRDAVSRDAVSTEESSRNSMAQDTVRRGAETSHFGRLGPGSPVSDLFTLSQCDYIIGPHSTFSQWASFYGGVPLFHMNKSTDTINTLKGFRVSNLEYLVP